MISKDSINPKNLNNTVHFLLEHNKEQSAIYSSPRAQSERRLYREEHPTEIAAFKCMDGRLNLSVFTGIQEGIIQPFRTMGGVFDLGDEDLGRLLEDWHEYAISKGRRCLPLATYHLSKGHKHRGCAGHEYETEDAINASRRFYKQLLHVFGGSTMYPILVGAETDRDSLIFHNKSGKVLIVENILNNNEEEINRILREMYPEMHDRIRKDLIPLLVGNQKHILDVIEKKREPLDLEHRERTICFGRGFDWLHKPNQALIIGPFGDVIEKSIITAGNLLLKNVREGRVSKDDGFAIMTAGLYYEEGVNRHRIQVKSYKLYKRIRQILEKNVPELFDYDVQYLVGVTSHDTRLFTPIDVGFYDELLETRANLSDDELGAITVEEESVIV